MSPKRVYFGNLSHYTTPMLPYQWGILRAFAELDPEIRAGYSFERPIFWTPRPANNDEANRIVDDEVARMPDPAVFATSNYVWNFRFHMRVSQALKRRFPHCVTIAGGPHIPEVAGDFFERHPFIDILIHGEGEVPFRAVLRELLRDRPALAEIPGITLQIDGKGHFTGPSKVAISKKISEEELPSPYLLGYFDEMVEPLRRAAGEVWSTWETNRGCPYSCTFCEWGVAATTKLKRFDMERLKRELAKFAELRIDQIMCADANFGILDRDVELAHDLVRHRATSGFPTFFSTNFAKNSNDSVFEISDAVAKYGMMRGTTLAMQSVDPTVLDAIERGTIGTARYQEIKSRYDAAGIPTYVDLILGLPEETKTSFINGIGTLLETGHHDDIRVFGLELLPNTPLNRDRVRYGMRTLPRRTYPFDDVPTTELVFETNTMSAEEIIECRTFVEMMISTLHSGGYTRYLSMFLHERGVMSYQQFYVSLFDWAQTAPGSPLSRYIERMRAAWRSFYTNNQAGTPDDDHNPYRGKKKSFYPSERAWLGLNSEMHDLYSFLRRFLGAARTDPHSTILADLFAFQQDALLTPDYDPSVGKDATYEFTWPEYFFGTGELRQAKTVVHYADTLMGQAYQHPLVKGSLPDFALAAVGNYYPDGKHRRFVHQPSNTTWTFERAHTEAFAVRKGSVMKSSALPTASPIVREQRPPV